MDARIFKYPILIVETQTVQMPKGCRVLSAQFQGDQLCLWALVDSERELSAVTIKIFGTGAPVTGFVIPEHFVSTVQDSSGFVWHIFLGQYT